MTVMNIGYRRLASQRIEGQKFETPEEVVRWMGAMQAQDYGQALWAVGSRTASATITEVEKAIADRKIVLTWPMRGTIHFVAAEDAKWMVALSETRMFASQKKRREDDGLTDKVLARCEQVFHEALQGGKCLSRAEMIGVLESTRIDPKGQRGYHILSHFSQAGLLCFGPKRDKEQTFTLLDEWVPKSRNLTREESLAELASRYISSHGPATMKDFAGWAGLTLADAKTGLLSANPALTTQKIDSREFWLSRDYDHNEFAHGVNSSIVHLLAGFDEFLLGYKDRSDVLDARFADKVVPGKNGIFFPTIVAKGRVVGTWKRIVKKNVVEITFDPFEAFGSEKTSITEAAERYGTFIGKQLVLK